MFLLRIIEQITWRPGIGDPTFIGWLIVFFYAICFVASIACLIKSLFSTRPQPKTILFWCGTSLIILLLGINKQLDFQTLLTQIGRALAKEQGWYENRRSFQFFFIIGVTLGGLGLVAWISYLFRSVFKQNWLGFLGLAFLCIFVTIRAASFHKVDRMLGLELLGLRINPLIELSGIVLVIMNALRSCGNLLRPR